MPLPAVGFFAWLLGLFGTAIGSFATWLMQRFVYEKAIRYALVTAFLVAAAALFLTLSLSIKALIIGAQIAMPSTLGAVTYFLPSNLNQVFAILVTVRVSAAIYRWTVNVMRAYLPGAPGYGSLVN